MVYHPQWKRNGGGQSTPLFDFTTRCLQDVEHHRAVRPPRTSTGHGKPPQDWPSPPRMRRSNFNRARHTSTGTAIPPRCSEQALPGSELQLHPCKTLPPLVAIKGEPRHSVDNKAQALNAIPQKSSVHPPRTPTETWDLALSRNWLVTPTASTIECKNIQSS